MNKYISIIAVGLIMSYSCTSYGQSESKQAIGSQAQSVEIEIDLPENDPYFIESTTIHSHFGPSSITRNILQDTKGNIWLATWEGIIKYNPNYLPTGKGGFTNYTNKEGLKRFHVFAILEDRKGNIWFGTIGAGVYKYDGKSFTHFTTKDGLVYNGIGCFLEDKFGNIWIGTQNGLSKYDGSSFTNFTKKDGLISEDINSIIEDNSGQLWLGTRGATYLYDGKIFKEFTNKEGQPFTNVRSIIEDKNGNIWLGGNDGLWRYNGSTFTNLTKDFIGYIYEDSKRNIWTSSAVIGSNIWGLSRYDITSLQTGKITPTQIKVEEGMFFGITEDREGNIWLGTLKGVYRYDCVSFEDFKETK